MRVNRVMLAAFSAVSLTMGVGMSPAASQSGKPEPAAGPQTATERRAAAIEAAGQRLADLAETRGALGAYFDESSGQHVMVVPAGMRPSAADLARSIGAPARVQSVDVTRAAVDEFRSRLSARTFHSEATNHTYASYFDVMSGKMVVQSDAPGAVVAALTAGYPGAVDVRAGSVAEDFSRQSDTSPFWGGAAIKNSSGAVCSSGFTVRKSNGVRYMTTAGHCYTLNTTVRTRGGNVILGTVVQRAPISSRDMELIGGKSYAQRIYVGGTNSTSSKAVVGAANPVVGTTGYCRSGQTTGERCGQRVVSITASFCPTSGCKHNVIAYNAGGLSAGGDSGAPVYWPSSSTTVSIRGMHLGSSSSGTMFAERWSTISATLAVSIVT